MSNKNWSCDQKDIDAQMKQMLTQAEQKSELDSSPCFPILAVDARVRYWEDATVNGKDDYEGTMIPFRDGDSWKPSIDLQNGRIIGWPEGTTADIHYKVCDDGDYWLADANGTKRMKWRGDYVPDSLLCMGDRGYGDYIILTVMPNGQIAEWSFPAIDFYEWIYLENDKVSNENQIGGDCEHGVYLGTGCPECKAQMRNEIELAAPTCSAFLRDVTTGWETTKGDNEIACHSRMIGGVLCRWWGDGAAPSGVEMLDTAFPLNRAGVASTASRGDTENLKK